MYAAEATAAAMLKLSFLFLANIYIPMVLTDLMWKIDKHVVTYLRTYAPRILYLRYQVIIVNFSSRMLSTLFPLFLCCFHSLSVGHDEIFHETKKKQINLFTLVHLWSRHAIL